MKFQARDATFAIT